jgi:tRNA nucleotidyltransferase (CCA-adding enzyme)
LEQAAKLTNDTAIRFAALTHDLGKALSDPSTLPHHYGHEKKGLKPIKTLSQRFRFPNNFKELALLVSEYHTHIHKALELKPQTILKVLKQCDAFRRPERFEAILISAKADSRGRTGFEDINYLQADYFRELLKNTQTIEAKHFVEQGFKGKELGERIDLERLKVIKNTLKPLAN